MEYADSIEEGQTKTKQPMERQPVTKVEPVVKPAVEPPEDLVEKPRIRKTLFKKREASVREQTEDEKKTEKEFEDQKKKHMDKMREKEEYKDVEIYENKPIIVRFPKKGHIAMFTQGDKGLIRKEMTTTFKLERDYETHSAWATFKQKGFGAKPVRVPFFSHLAVINDDGTYTAFFDAVTYTQTVLAQDDVLREKVNKLTAEFKLEVQGLIAVQNTLERMFREKLSWLREHLHDVLLSIALIFLAIALIYQTGTMSGLTQVLSPLANQISQATNIGQYIVSHLGAAISGGSIPANALP